MTSRPQIIFLGNGPLADGALKTLEQHFDIVFHARAREDLETVIELKTKNPELGAVLASFGSLVPDKILALFEPVGILNIHPSKLPKYRGPSPIESAILNGDTDFSYSIMKLAHAMDAGPVYHQETLQNLPLEKSKIYEALSTAAATWLNKNFTQLPPPLEQENDAATYTHKFEKKDGKIDPETETADEIQRKIIAFQGFPKVKYDFNGHTCAILESHLGDDGLLKIKCKDGYIAVDRLQPDGRKPMDAKSFLNGYGA